MTQNQVEVEVEVSGGIDTHHVAVIDALGRHLDDIQVPATRAGYRTAVRFLRSQVGLVAIGIDCTGSYGAGMTRAARNSGLEVVEVNQPNKFDRRMQGMTDTFDAYSATEAVLSGAPRLPRRAVML